MRSVSCVRSILVLVAVVLGIGWASKPVSAQSMVGLGNLPGTLYPYSEARNTSADGSTVVGFATNEDHRIASEMIHL